MEADGRKKNCFLESIRGSEGRADGKGEDLVPKSTFSPDRAPPSKGRHWRAEARRPKGLEGPSRRERMFCDESGIGSPDPNSQPSIQWTVT